MRYTDYHQNLIVSSSATFHRILRKSFERFLRNPANEQTNTYTNTDENITSLAGGNTVSCFGPLGYILMFYIVYVTFIETDGTAIG